MTKLACEKCVQDPVLPKHRKRPKRFEIGNTQRTTPLRMLRADIVLSILRALDLLVSGIKRLLSATWISNILQTRRAAYQIC